VKLSLTPEQELQYECIKWMKRHLSSEVVFFHVPNGGKRSMREGAIFKAIGVLAGVPDLIIAWPGTIAAVELKAGKGRASEDQIEVQARMSAIGWHVSEVRSLDQLQLLLRNLGAPIATKDAVEFPV
jgi:hypothetical protein